METSEDGLEFRLRAGSQLNPAESAARVAIPKCIYATIMGGSISGSAGVLL